ncbi:MAG: glycoside hydrolase family 25 protein [Sporichthyaceae bacterium]
MTVDTALANRTTPRTWARGRRRQIAAAVVGLLALALLLRSCGSDGEDAPPVAIEGSPLVEKIRLTTAGPYVGPDVAKRQQDFGDGGATGLLDANDLLADGVDFLFAKASEGRTFVDGYFAENRRRANAAGLLFGAYHYLSPGNGAAQAEAFHNRLLATGGTRGVMLMVDVEFSDQAMTRGPSYDDVLAFTRRLGELVPDRRIIVYTLGRYWGKESSTGELGNPPAPPNTVLNWASYLQGRAPAFELADRVVNGSNPYLVNRVGTWENYTFRQFTSTATYRQYQGQRLASLKQGQSTMDFNITFVPRDELLGLAGLTAADAVVPG